MCTGVIHETYAEVRREGLYTIFGKMLAGVKGSNTGTIFGGAWIRFVSEV